MSLFTAYTFNSLQFAMQYNYLELSDDVKDLRRDYDLLLRGLAELCVYSNSRPIANRYLNIPSCLLSKLSNAKLTKTEYGTCDDDCKNQSETNQEVAPNAH
ncbi:uncharacterized protein MCYG_00984 [Microsporum canis CBS 113480]|uniref:Uncharacterized protein n=1 Tax=Arthroderma otae (strain ATCC MYA-4605 / CBS 113480) TaxID=554155 RepID=C5FE62_ARTOC|nr:uncharacterized protein MCYG_00984 [Microsporum canis CBS 113480]EEQ28096.1 predicted protein [Microsporum canis CBS 113480]